MKRKLKIEIGLAVLLLLIALFGSFLAPYDPLKVNYDFSLQPPSFLHIFGTDKLGRDVFSRILCGAKTSFGLTFLMLFLIVFIGMIVGFRKYKKIEPVCFQTGGNYQRNSQSDDIRPKTPLYY